MDETVDAKINTQVESKATETESTTVSLKKKTELSFEERKKARAQRFGIPLSFEEKKAERAKRFGLNIEEDKKAQRAKRFGITDLNDKNNNSKKRQHADKKKGGENKKQKNEKNHKKSSEKSEEPLLSKEEIMKRLKRGEKYGADPQQTDKLKAMLRKYRFSS